jgi:hypothetical protein
MWTIRVVNFKSDEKSDHSIDIFSTNQNAPFWRIFDKIDMPHLQYEKSDKNLMDLWCIDISNFKLVTVWGSSGAYQRIV